MNTTNCTFWIFPQQTQYFHHIYVYKFSDHNNLYNKRKKTDLLSKCYVEKYQKRLVSSLYSLTLLCICKSIRRVPTEAFDIPKRDLQDLNIVRVKCRIIDQKVTKCLQTIKAKYIY